MKKIRETKIVFLLICSIVFLLCAAAQAFAATYYVSPTGSDSSSGSSSAPFRTIQKAANIVNPGDTVIIRNGTYTDTNGDGRIVSLRRSGTSTNWITFKAENKWGAVLDGRNTTHYGWVINTNTSYVRIEELEIKNTSDDGVFISGGSTNIYLYGNKVHDVARRQILCTDSDIENGHSGVYSSYLANNITVDSNLFYAIGRLTGGCATDKYNKDHGLYVCSAYSTVINNIFYDITVGWPVHIYNGPFQFHASIINNTFYGSIGSRDGHIAIAGTYNDILIQNNISHSPRNSFVRTRTTKDDTNIFIKNNLVYGASVSSHSGAGYTIANNITGQDPKFVNLTGRDFHLQFASPAIGQGDGRLAPRLDHDGKGRAVGEICDIGAYEYLPSAK